MVLTGLIHAHRLPNETIAVIPGREGCSRVQVIRESRKHYLTYLAAHLKPAGATVCQGRGTKWDLSGGLLQDHMIMGKWLSKHASLSESI